MRAVVAFAAIWLLVLSASPGALAAPFGGTDLDEFCSKRTKRHTVLYVDGRSIDANDVAWARRLINDLMSNLSPHERMTVVALDSVGATTQEIWSTCFPALWPDEPRSDGDFFSRSTEDKLEEGQKQFRKLLRASINEVFTKHKVDAGKDAKVRLIRALVNDTSRLTRETAVPRVIIYSDLMERSDLAKITEDAGLDVGAQIAERLNADFGHALVYGFGVGGDETPDLREAAKGVFRSFFRTSKGHVVDLSAEVGLPGSAPVTVQRYTLEGSWEERTISGRMVLLANADDQLQDSYVYFPTQLAGSVISGSYSCSGETCELNAKTEHKTLTDEKGETVQLEGSPSEMSGEFGWPEINTPEGKEAVVPVTARAQGSQ